MEVREIVEIEQNELTIVVHFRLDTDGDDLIRVQEFSFKEIEKAGFDYLTEYIDTPNIKQAFIAGAKSLEAKNFWQQGSYTEEEVRKLLHKYEKGMLYYGRDGYYMDCFPEATDDWFEKNKKK